MPCPYRDTRTIQSALILEKYQQLQTEYLSHKTDDLKVYKNFDNQRTLLLITDDLIARNAIGAYVITGAAHGYSFQNAIIQVAENQLQICKWHEVTENKVDIKYLQHTINWQKVINGIKRDGHRPDHNLPPDALKDWRNRYGRFVTTYAVSREDGTWATIHSGSRRLLVHRIRSLMYRIINQAM